jgi:hypothetical protein
MSPILGTIGLILIVLEGSLELDLISWLIKKIIFGLFLPLIVLAFFSCVFTALLWWLFFQG